MDDPPDHVIIRPLPCMSKRCARRWRCVGCGKSREDRMLTRRSILAATAVAALCSPGLAQDGYPSGPVTMVVSFPPGGSLDVTTRAIAPKLQERLGKPVVVENRVGGGGVIATNSVAKAAPD